jgi:hypothetical protein
MTSDKATVHIPDLVCLQQICSHCESSEDVTQDCARCGKRRHSFWEDPVGDMLSYLREPLPWAKQIVAIAHNAKSFDLQFILDRAVFLNWRPELIMNGQKFMCMTVKNIKFIDSISYLLFPPRKFAGAFGLSASKSWYPHYFNSKDNLIYVGPIPDITYYGADQMGVAEKAEFLEWYE